MLVGTLSGFLDTDVYFVWIFVYEDVELILPKMQSYIILTTLVLCLGFWIRGCRADPANVGCYFVWVFGYRCVLCLDFCIRGCRAHPAKVGTFCGFLNMRMQSSSFQILSFVWVFGYENEEFILPNLVVCLDFWI